jgi:DNA primase
MSSFIDFEAVKEAVSFADAIEYLDLKLPLAGNQFRGPCPCGKGDRRALVITHGKGFYCWGDKKGGRDVIALAAHVLQLPMKDAAIWLAERAGIVPSQQRNSTSRDSTVPRNSSRERGGESSKLEPLSYLEHDHDAVAAVGFDPEVAKQLGIGYAPRGIMRGLVAVPIRDEEGTLLGYIGITEAKLPSDFTAKVVPLQKRA